MLLEGDASWKEHVEQKIHGLEAAISKVAGKLSCPELLDLIQPTQSNGTEFDGTDSQKTTDQPDGSLQVPTTRPIEKAEQTWAAFSTTSIGFTLCSLIRSIMVILACCDCFRRSMKAVCQLSCPPVPSTV